MATKKLTKKERVLNLLNKGKSVTWSTLRTRFDLTSPRAMIDTLRSEGHMIYINENTGTNGNNTSYRMGTPTKAIIAAGVNKVLGTKTSDYSEIVAAGIRSLYGNKVYAYSNQ